MAGWGRYLAEQGFFVVVPSMPFWADHAGNGRAVVQLVEFLLDDPAFAPRLDSGKVGLVGFSAGGLATFTAAAESSRVAVWVGLDPVDRNGQAARLADRVSCRGAVLLAEPSDCNRRGNWIKVLEAMNHRWPTVVITSAVHPDCESPTDWLAERACGTSAPARRELFKKLAAEALNEGFSRERAGFPSAARLEADGRIRRLPEPVIPER